VFIWVVRGGFGGDEMSEMIERGFWKRDRLDFGMF